MAKRTGHELADQRSLLLHREVARRLRNDPALAERGRARVDAWQREGSLHPLYVEQWQQLFSGGLSAVLEAIEDEGELGRALRQVSPFAYVLPARERWRLLAKAKESDA
jgi:hypothetical protein